MSLHRSLGERDGPGQAPAAPPELTPYTPERFTVTLRGRETSPDLSGEAKHCLQEMA